MKGEPRPASSHYPGFRTFEQIARPSGVLENACYVQVSTLVKSIDQESPPSVVR